VDHPPLEVIIPLTKINTDGTIGLNEIEIGHVPVKLLEFLAPYIAVLCGDWAYGHASNALGPTAVPLFIKR
jgi:hypothetical protein